MLHKFTIKNYRSIVDLTIDMSFAEGKAPNGYKEWDSLPFVGKTERMVPCLGLYGANASGKSNILKAFEIFTDVLKNKGKFDPNRINCKSEFTTFEIVVSNDKNVYKYLIEYNEKRINKEILELNGLSLFIIEDSKGIFEKLEYKSYDLAKLTEIFDVECKKDNIHKRTFINVIKENYPGLNKYINEAYDTLRRLFFMRTNNLPPIIAVDLFPNETMNDNDLMDEVANHLKKLDIDINRLECEKQETEHKSVSDFLKSGDRYANSGDILVLNDEKKLIINKMYSYHTDFEGQEVKFNFSDESSGTKTVAGLIGLFLGGLRNGETIIVDEIDVNLHSLLLTEIIKLFKSKKYNQKGAQLIFTAHNTDILRDGLIRVSEMGIVSKTLRKGTKLSRAVDLGIRSDKNLRKAYLNGELDGIPFPYL